MVGQLIQRTYKYTEAVLGSGVVVTTHKVVIEDNKVVSVENANVDLGKQGNFSFSINNYGVDGSKTHSTSGVPEGVSAEVIMKEFIAFVEADIV